jgi:hypothetical protein
VKSAQQTYEGWWLGKRCRIRAQAEQPFRRVEKVRLVGPPSFVYGSVWLTFDDGEEMFVVTPSYRPRKRDVLVEEDDGVAYESVGQIVRPRRGNYVDYGAERRVIVRRGKRELHWVGGSTCAIGIGLRTYSPSRLVFRPDGEHLDGETLHEGGRLSRALLERYAPRLRALFELPPSAPPVFEGWRAGRTLVITG